MRGCQRVDVQRRVEVFEGLDLLGGEGGGVAEGEGGEADVEEREDRGGVGRGGGGGEVVRGEDGGGAELVRGEQGGEVAGWGGRGPEGGGDVGYGEGVVDFGAEESGEVRLGRAGGRHGP